MKNIYQKDKYIIMNLQTMDYMKDEDGFIVLYDTVEDALLTCGMYEFEDVWVLKLIINYKEQ